MNIDLSRLLPAAVIAAIFLTVILTELIKKADRNDRLKGYRIYIPAALSLLESALLAFGEFFSWATIFAVSVFGYEAIYRKIRTWLGMDESTSKD